MIVLFESAYGNTEKVAVAVGGALSGDVQLLRARAVHTDPTGFDVMIVGAPTYGGRPMPEMQELLGRLSESSLKGVRAAAFDTRLDSRFAKVFGYAAPKIAAALEAKGATLVIPPEGFIVRGKKGPLAEGEEARAADWGKRIWEKVKGQG